MCKVGARCKMGIKKEPERNAPAWFLLSFLFITLLALYEQIIAL